MMPEGRAQARGPAAKARWSRPGSRTGRPGAAAEDSTRHIHFQVTPCRVLPHSVQITEPDGRTVQMSDTARSSRYEIRVEGVLDPRWTAWFEGLAIGSDDSQ